ncbi:unnamed protein product [Paramecium sonneborni]|uniref:Uncharacterized protein n=1 Tax=Paramecium sonneborni TaxID=65129 RepID=A0A8S1RKP5_9CILI|nr:unnamed protein product [Paramecium sonneborni]
MHTTTVGEYLIEFQHLFGIILLKFNKIYIGMEQQRC